MGIWNGWTKPLGKRGQQPATPKLSRKFGPGIKIELEGDMLSVRGMMTMPRCVVPLEAVTHAVVRYEGQGTHRHPVIAVLGDGTELGRAECASLAGQQAQQAAAWINELSHTPAPSPNLRNCAHCGAPSQPVGQPCNYCAKSV